MCNSYPLAPTDKRLRPACQLISIVLPIAINSALTADL